ncbi:MAG: HD domain-containing protein [Candidatus Promineifilaceae bacterium]|nr:HD domain-containing protein [Candidatus Promineifilaceae bacterium]
MKRTYIKDLKAKDELQGEPFLLEDVVHRTTRDGRPYLLCTYRDRTGQTSGVYWDVPADIQSWIRPGLAVLVTGQVNLYKNALQIHTTGLNREQDADMSQFLNASERPLEEMEYELEQYMQRLAQPWQKLVRRVLLEPSFYRRFVNAPAARSMHHAYVGGLLEHTLSMAKVGLFLADHYPYVNPDLLLAGILLHDVGKAHEYDVGAGFTFTDDGRLVGHIVRAVAMVEKAAVGIDALPDADLRHLIHLLASHHGTLEWGSPVVPKTIEAVLLHQLDLLDSRVQGFFDHLSRHGGEEEKWSARTSQMFNTILHRPDGFLENGAEEA